MDFFLFALLSVQNKWKETEHILSPSLLIGPWDAEYVSVVLFCCILDIMLCCVWKIKIVDNKKKETEHIRFLFFFHVEEWYLKHVIGWAPIILPFPDHLIQTQLPHS